MSKQQRIGDDYVTVANKYHVWCIFGNLRTAINEARNYSEAGINVNDSTLVTVHYKGMLVQTFIDGEGVI